MKQFFKMFFAALLAIIVAGILVFGIISSLMVSAVSSIGEKTVSTSGDATILELDLSKHFSEQSTNNTLASFSNENGYTPGLFDVTRTIENAATDDKIKGIYIKGETANNSWATNQQIRDALVKFKKSNKFIYAYAENMAQSALYVSSIADSIFINPVGSVEFDGLSSTITFFKGTLDKLQIEPQIFYAGKFKSATEPFRLDKASEPNKLQIHTLQNGIWSIILEAVAEHSGADTATVNSWVQQGKVLFAKDALSLNIIDGLWYEDQVIDLLKSKLGKKQDDKLTLTSINDYATEVKAKRKSLDERVAVLFAEGGIQDGEAEGGLVIASKDMVKTIRDIKNNDKIKAVVMRVNSPGGSALASDVILRELELLQEKKPLVVSMGDVAASGGYYISTKASKIYALPTTITGSIGVFATMFNLTNALKSNLGITNEAIKNAPYADFPSATRKLTEDEGQRLQRFVDTTYQIFLGHVSAGRKMTIADVDSIAQGRVWNGIDAKRIGLVDEIGDLNDAVVEAAKLAKIKDYSITTYPNPQDKLEQLLKRFSKNPGVEITKSALESELGQEYQLYKQYKEILQFANKPLAVHPFIVTIQ